MPIRLFSDNERPSAADFNRYFLQQQYAIKTSDTSRSSTTTLVDDPHLTMAVVAGTNYFVTAYLWYNGHTQASGTGDLKIRFTAPGGSEFHWVSDALGSTTADANNGIDGVSRSYQGLGNTPAPGTIGTGTNLSALVKGLLKVGDTSGAFTLQWAQNTSGSTATTLRIYSTVVARRLTT